MTVSVTISPFDKNQTGSLQSDWQTLEAKTMPSVFLSWGWISSWLSVVTQPLMLIKAVDEQGVTGLAILVESKRKLFGVLPITQWYLHRTGDVQNDQMWIEYNDMLAINGATLMSMIQAIAKHAKHQEVIVGMSSTDTIARFNCAFSGSRELINSTGYRTNFQKFKTSWQQQTFSKNTRQKIQKNIRRLEAIGNIRFNITKDKSELESYFKQISKLHIQRWQNTNTPSGFTNPIFSHFLKNLIDSDVDFQVAVLTIDKVQAGFLIHLVHNHQVSFYLSAINRELFENVNLGLILHYYSMLYYQEQGLDSYDFLLGDYQFKKSLSNEQYQQNMLSFHNENILLKIEHKLRSIKQKLKTNIFSQLTS